MFELKSKILERLKKSALSTSAICRFLNTKTTPCRCNSYLNTHQKKILSIDSSCKIKLSQTKNMLIKLQYNKKIFYIRGPFPDSFQNRIWDIQGVWFPMELWYVTNPLLNHFEQPKFKLNNQKLITEFMIPKSESCTVEAVQADTGERSREALQDEFPATQP